MKFYLLLIEDLFTYPIAPFISRTQIISRKKRQAVIDPKVYVCIHEWGGYSLQRNKQMKNGNIFACGLEGQLNRYEQYRKDKVVDLTVTMSDIELSKDINYIKTKTDHFIAVSNRGMDFNGYYAFYQKIKEQPNAYIILSNSSVNSTQTDFLKGYMTYLDNNPDIGLLGISYSTKVYQTLIRNNFTPHIQSFFILTTIDVLNNIVKANNEIFPGVGITDKRLLIRKGEIALSQIALKLGYNLAIIMPDTGIPFKFTAKTQWNNLLGDIRLHIQHPNVITPISSSIFIKTFL